VNEAGINEHRLIIVHTGKCVPLRREDMGSNEENRLPNGDVRVHRDVDWARYGLRDPETQENAKRDSEDSGNNALGPEMYQAGANELFAQEYVRNMYDNTK